MNNKGIFYTNVSDYETKEDMMNDFIALRMYDIVKDKEIEEHKNTIATQKQEIERLQKRIDELEKFWRGEMKQKIYQTLDIVRGDKK